MVNYREILRLHSLNYTQRQIAASVHSSRNTISEVLHLAHENGLSWPLDDSVSNETIRALLYPDRPDAGNPRKEPDYSYIHKELSRPGVHLTLLWTEYCSTCTAEGNIPYMLLIGTFSSPPGCRLLSPHMLPFCNISSPFPDSRPRHLQICVSAHLSKKRTWASPHPPCTLKGS